MKKRFISGAMILALFGAAAAYTVSAGTKEAPVKTVTGEVVSLCNYLVNDARGPEAAPAGQFLVEKKGLPVAILDDQTGTLYIAILKLNNRANEKLGPLMGKIVNARGPVYEKNGVHLIEIQIVSEALVG